MHVLVSEVSLFVEELPYGDLALYPLFGGHAIDVVLGTIACLCVTDFKRLRCFLSGLHRSRLRIMVNPLKPIHG